MLPGAAPAWKSNPDHPHYEAASKAVQYVYNIVPDFTREGGSIPVALTFQVCPLTTIFQIFFHGFIGA